jgi:hypothetical protein
VKTNYTSGDVHILSNVLRRIKKKAPFAEETSLGHGLGIIVDFNDNIRLLERAN